MPNIPIITEISTNALATITNGTKIYQQQEITITYISHTITNITNTDWITNTINNIPQLNQEWYQDPIWGTVFTAFSVIIMACTFFQIKAQQKKQEKDTQYREDKKELREYIEKYMLSEVEKFKEYSIGMDSEIPIQDIERFNSLSLTYLARLIFYSSGLFYEDKLKDILNKVPAYSHIVKFPQEYSDVMKRVLFVLLQIISNNLYKALIDKQTFRKLMNQIDLQINLLEKKLTPEEKEKIKLYNSQQNN